MALTNLSETARLQHEQELIDRLIAQHDRKRGCAESESVGNGTAVWVGMHDWLSDGDLARVKVNWELSEEASEAVIAFYRRHKHVIDARITLEEDSRNDPR